MITLALDTSTPVASVALRVGERVLERAEPVTTYSERLLPIVDALFAEAGVPPQQLAAICCAAGPGSFTGLRIGLSTAKGLCLATGARLAMVPTLAALAVDAPPGATVVCGIDAYRGELYAGLWTLDADGEPRAVRPALAAFATRPEALAAALGDARPAFYAGDGFAKYPAAIPAGAVAIARGDRTVARAVLALGLRALGRGEDVDPRGAAPLYVRPPAAEEKRGV